MLAATAPKIVVEAGQVQLQSDTVDRNAAILELPDHGIDRVGFAVEGVTLCLVVKQQHLGIGFVGPTKSLLNVSRALIGQADSWPVVPGRVPRCASFIQPLVQDNPGEDVARIVLHHGCDVLMQEF